MGDFIMHANCLPPKTMFAFMRLKTSRQSLANVSLFRVFFPIDRVRDWVEWREEIYCLNLAFADCPRSLNRPFVHLIEESAGFTYFTMQEKKD